LILAGIGLMRAASGRSRKIKDQAGLSPLTCAIMEVLSAITFPQVLRVARETILFAWTLYSSVTDRKAECKVLLERCNDLILEVGKQVDGEDYSDVMSENLHDLEWYVVFSKSRNTYSPTNQLSACLAVQIAVTTLASKSFSWRLLHQSKIARVISQAQTAVTDASANFNVCGCPRVDAH
jgi:hypothetical protein